MIPSSLLLPIIALCHAIGAHAIADTRADSIEFPLEVFEVVDDKMVVVFLKLEDVLASPEWHPGDSAPPLDLEAAVRLAIGSDEASRRVREIKLTEINDPNADHRWYYLVKLTEEAEAGPTDLYVALLMNGKAFPGLVQPQMIK